MQSLGSSKLTEYLGIISFQLHTLTCQAVVSFYTPVSRDEAHAYRKCKCTASMLKCDPSSTGCLILVLKLRPVGFIACSPFLSVAVMDIVWSGQLTTPTTNPLSFPTLSPWLLVLQCLLLADKEFMLSPLFTEKNVPTCVWPDMPFVWVEEECPLLLFWLSCSCYAAQRFLL